MLTSLSPAASRELVSDTRYSRQQPWTLKSLEAMQKHALQSSSHCSHKLLCIVSPGGSVPGLFAPAQVLHSLVQMEAVASTWQTIKKMNVRTLLMQAVQLGLVLTSALIIWKTLMLITGTDSPIVVVLSGSMEPGMYKGDILFLHRGKGQYRTGEIVVFNIENRTIPIVHRILKVHERGRSNTIELLTKGDNNKVFDDMGIYAAGQNWISPQHITGRVVGILPQLGWATILMNEYPKVKYALIGLLGLLVITNKND